MKNLIFLSLITLFSTQNLFAANHASNCKVNRIIINAANIQVILRECSNVKCPRAPSNEIADFFMKTSNRTTSSFLDLIKDAMFFNKKISITANTSSTTPLQCRFSNIQSVSVSH